MYANENLKLTTNTTSHEHVKKHDKNMNSLHFLWKTCCECKFYVKHSVIKCMNDFQTSREEPTLILLAFLFSNLLQFLYHKKCYIFDHRSLFLENIKNMPILWISPILWIATLIIFPKFRQHILSSWIVRSEVALQSAWNQLIVSWVGVALT